MRNINDLVDDLLDGKPSVPALTTGTIQQSLGEWAASYGLFFKVLRKSGLYYKEAAQMTARLLELQMALQIAQAGCCCDDVA